MTPEADLTGRTLAHYRLVERIGSGGMGVVYRAEDTHLDRIVAIKVLPADAVADPDRRRRFVQEAKAAAALNHPNIIHVYDIGSADGIDFIAMEYVSGTTLDQAILNQEPASIEGIPPELGQIIARCLRKDPDRRIQHMDDVALALEEVLDAARPTRSRDLASPTAPPPGTGSGSKPSRRWLAAALVCLSLAATLVIGNVGGLRDRLSGPGGPSPIRPIAVLPLENLSGNPEQEYFVDGMTDAITTELGRVSGFDKVSAWQSMKVYKKTTKSLGEIASEVDVDIARQVPSCLARLPRTSWWGLARCSGAFSLNSARLRTQQMR